MYSQWKEELVETLKVSARSNPKSVAGAMAVVVERDGKVAIQAVGAGAVNQVVKAIAIARGFVAPRGIDLIVQISFCNLEIDGADRTGMRFLVTPRE